MAERLIISGYKCMGVSQKCDPLVSAHQGGLEEMKSLAWAWHMVSTHPVSAVSPPLLRNIALSHCLSGQVIYYPE